MHRAFLRTIAILLGITLIILVLVVLRVATKPISLNFLAPHLERALTPENSSYKVRLEQVVLDWTNSERGLDITALEAKVIDENGNVVISIPSISVGLSGRALLRGIVAPKNVELLKPNIHLTVGSRGGVELRVGEGEKEKALLMLSHTFDNLLSQRDPAHPSSYIKSIKVWGGSLTIEDSRNGVSWHAPKAELSLERAEQGVRIAASLRVEITRLGEDDATDQGKKEKAAFFINGFYPRNGRVLSLRVSFTDFKPALLAHAYPTLFYLKGVKVPIKGAVGLAADSKGRITKAWFHLSADRGKLELPFFIDHSTKVKDLYLGGELNTGLSNINVNEFHITVDSTNVMGDATITRDGDLIRLDGKARADSIAVNNLSKFWPRTLLSGVREVVTQKISRGVIDRVAASFIIEVGSKGSELINRDRHKGRISLKQMEVNIEYSGVTAGYLSSMPPVINARGTATFTTESLDINVSEGETEGVLLEKGKVTIGGLDGDKPWAKITARISGSLGNALKAMKHSSLRITTLARIDPENVSGTFDAEISANLPVKKDVGSEEITLVANAEIVEAGTGKVLRELIGAELSNGKLSLRIGKKGREVTYNVLINELTVDASPHLSGTITGNLSLTSGDPAKQRLMTVVNFLGTRIELPELRWRKTPETPGSATFTMVLEKWTPSEIKEFSVESEKLEIRGSARFRADEQGTRIINLRRLAVGRTDINGSVLIKPHSNKKGTKHKGRYSYSVFVRGKSLDVKPILEFVKKMRNQSKLEEEGSEKSKLDAEIPSIKIDAKLGLVFTGTGQRIENVSGVITHNGRMWESIIVYGEISGKPIVLRLTPKGGGEGGIKSELTLNSEDAGSTLRVLELYKNMKGGKLRLRTHITDNHIEGKLVIKNCLLLDAPVLTKMFTVASFTGLTNLITGEGIRFDKIKIRFSMTRDQIEVEDGIAWGSNIGITVERGHADLRGDSIDFKGVLIPAYTLTKFLNKIPLIGKLITGGKGSGIIAANYNIKGSLRDPDVFVNPLSVLTPGILRGFINALKEAAPGADESVGKESTITPP